MRGRLAAGARPGSRCAPTSTSSALVVARPPSALQPTLPARARILRARITAISQLRAGGSVSGSSRCSATVDAAAAAERAPLPPPPPADARAVPLPSLARTATTWALSAALTLSALTADPTGTAWAATTTAPPPKADTAAVGKCLLSRCQGALAQCLGDAGCAKNLVCLNACSLKAKNGDEETACQIKCGDRYGDAAVEAFNACAVSQEKCVPQRADEGLFPVPPDCALDRTFDLSRFTGRWYITAGLNDLFDTFDCQVHYFATPGPTSLVAKINWRIAIPGGDFLERSTVQTFVQPQPADNPAVLLNHNNETLHYEDDWYVLASKPDEYVFVYYRGNNDAWSGYGGAVVYTKEAKLPEKYVPELEKAAEAAGLKWSDFKLTDNTCGPHPPRAPSLGAQVAREVGVLEGELEGELEGALRSFGRGFTRIERKLGRELTETEKQLEKELQEAERLVLEVERSFVEEEKELAQDLGSVVRRLFGGGR